MRGHRTIGQTITENNKTSLKLIRSYFKMVTHLTLAHYIGISVIATS